MRVSKMAGQPLNRSNSRSFVILGDSTDKSTLQLKRGDSLPQNSLPRFEKRAPLLGSVAERDSRGNSGSFGRIISFRLLIYVDLSPTSSANLDKSYHDSVHTSASIKSPVEKRQVNPF